MRPDEISARVRQRLWLSTERPGQPRRAAERTGGVPAVWRSPSEKVEGFAYLGDRGRIIIQGGWQFFGTPDEHPDCWMRDPVTGIVSPSVPSSQVDFRDPAQVGSVKTLWEKNRHQHLQVLAAAYMDTRDERYANLVRDQLVEWLSQNPYLIGVNWASGIEIALRLVSWVWIERFLRGATVHEELFGTEGVIWEAAYQSQRLLRHTYSTGSSANNHLVAELLGVVVANAAWPVWQGCENVADESWKRLQTELLRQTFQGGYSAEQAVGYHAFVTEMGLVALLEARLSGREARPEFTERLASMVKAGSLFYSCLGERAEFGDSDDSQVLGFLPTESPRFGAVCALARHLLGIDQATVAVSEQAMAAASIAAGGLKPSVDLSSTAALSDAGIHVLRADTPAGHACVWMDIAPIGMLPLAAHGHADALSIVLHLAGQPVFIDPGTYEFGLYPEWRSYFRGSRAHNVVAVDDDDQFEQNGPFMWSVKGGTWVVERSCLDGCEVAAGSHDGYARKGGVGIVSRRVVLDRNGLSIAEHVEGHGQRVVEIRFHLHPSVAVELDGSHAMVVVSGSRLRFDLDPALVWVAAIGEPDAGWFSPSFGRKVPTTTLVGRATVTLPWEGACRLAFR